MRQQIYALIAAFVFVGIVSIGLMLMMVDVRETPPHVRPPNPQPTPPPVVEVVDAPSDGLGKPFARLAERRRTQLQNLQRYIAGRQYPENHIQRGERIPFFVDRNGVHCAVGDLMRHDGLGDTVRAISLADNHVVVREVRSGPLLVWVLTSGLLHEECARIQPTYGGRGWDDDDGLDRHREQERERVRAHLTSVYSDLVANNFDRLCEAFGRWMPHLRGEISAPAMGFVTGTTHGPVSLHNGSPRDIRFRVIELDPELRLRRVGPWSSLLAGQRASSRPIARHVFVEWRAGVAIAAEEQRITLTME